MADAEAAERYIEQSGLRGSDLAFGLGKSLRGKKVRILWLLTLCVLVLITSALAILFEGLRQSMAR
jgi:Mg/Co/Ni transporter MgtE